MPVLQEGKKFEERVRSTPREHPLNHHLVVSSPESPHHSREDEPEQSALTANLSGPYLQKLCKVMGLPLRSQSLTNKAPKCLCCYTREQNVRSRFRDEAKGAKAIARTMAFQHLGPRR